MTQQFDPLPHAPLSMPRQTLEHSGGLRHWMMRLWSIFARETPGSAQREH